MSTKTDEVRQTYGEFFTEWKWERFATLTFRRTGITEAKGIDHAKVWIRRLAKVFKIQIAAIIVPRHDDDRLHLHLLMLGKSNSGKTLNDVPPWIMKQDWERLYAFWKPANPTGLADVQLPRSNNAVSLYTAGNMKTWESTADLFESKYKRSWSDDEYAYHSFNHRLLKKARITA
jgi:hypothetical protein